MHFGNHLSRSEYRGLAALSIILTFFTIVFWWTTNHTMNSKSTIAIADSADQVHLFLDSIKQQQKRYKSFQKHHITPFQFDPNTTDSATFVKLGLPYWIAARIIHYRHAGGVFKKASDFKKIYGLSIHDFQVLLPYISITQNNKTHISTKTDSTHIFTTFQTRKDTKFRQLTHLDLNTTDSVTLLRIPGIGNYYAHCILRYKNLLGGYVNQTQLLEIKGLSQEILKWFYVNTSNISKLYINKMPFRQLLRHPYLNYEQVKAIFQYRQKFGPLHSLQELRNYEVFTPEDFIRLAPYVSFN